MDPSQNRPDSGLPRLYAILDVDLVHAKGLQPSSILEAWLAAGVRLVQLRAKSLTFGPMLAMAEQFVSLCRPAGARLIVNDRPDVVRLAEADGLHLGQDDLAVVDARRVIGAGQLVGVSTHLAGQTEAALKDGADYIAIGPVYPTTSKGHPDPSVGLAGVAAAAALTRLESKPLVAIGGITLESAPAVIEAGADAVAVISDLFAGDWRHRVNDYLRTLR